MQICSKCNYKNRDGVLICERCRNVLAGQTLLATRSMDSVFDLDVPIGFSEAPRQNMPGDCITLQLLDTPESLMIEVKKRVVIGRIGPHTVRMPDVDLSPYDAYSKGVSSQHAAIYSVDGIFKISDMGSLNGTYLNREGLVANAGYTLHSGDLLHLGRMPMQVHL